MGGWERPPPGAQGGLAKLPLYRVVVKLEFRPSCALCPEWAYVLQSVGGKPKPAIKGHLSCPTLPPSMPCSSLEPRPHSAHFLLISSAGCSGSWDRVTAFRVALLYSVTYPRKHPNGLSQRCVSPGRLTIQSSCQWRLVIVPCLLPLLCIQRNQALLVLHGQQVQKRINFHHIS